LTLEEIGVLEAASGLDADVFSDGKGKDPEEHFLRFAKNGSCVFLDATSGRHSCSVYAARPAICREYPSTHIQQVVCDGRREACLSGHCR
jgi:Fe-S-cluster containining protein